MFAIPGIVSLIVFVYTRPHELIQVLGKIPTLNLLTLLILLGWALDVRTGFTKLRAGPLLPWALGYFGWAMVTVAAKVPGNMFKELIWISVSLTLFLAVSQGVHTFRAISTLAGAILIAVGFISVVANLQALGPLTCMEEIGNQLFVPDGRPCTEALDCSGGLDTEKEWVCERDGPFGTNSTDGRVRYRGILADPNELALVMAIGLPLAFARWARERTWTRATTAVSAFLLIAICTVFTKSRSGQLAFLAVLGVYMLARVGWRGLLAAPLVALPVLLLGGRSNAAADESTELRFEAWEAGYQMWFSSPVFGVGAHQFAEHHIITAHNSYVLVLAEQSLPGLFFWTGTIWFAARWMFAVARHSPLPDGAVGKTWSLAVIASMVGLLISCNFLSFSYHAVFWLYMGLAGAIASAAREHRPDLEVRVRAVDLVGIFVVDVLFGIGLNLYLKIRGA